MPVGIGWNAGAVRARLLAKRRLGGGGCRDLARSESLDAALQSLQGGPYGHDVESTAALPSAQWAALAAPLWHLRVLAGWLPPAGAELLRVLVGWWEVLNVENLIADLAGVDTFPPYDLGRLETGWNRVRTADSLEMLRDRLAHSPWSDPGSSDPVGMVSWLRVSWAQRVSDEVDEASRSAAAWAALALARLVGAPKGEEIATPRVRMLGGRWREAADLGSLRENLPRDAAWILQDVDTPEDLWRAEVRWWRALDDESLRLLRHPGSGAEAVVGAFGVLLADAHRVQGALELAARGGTDDEVVDEAL